MNKFFLHCIRPHPRPVIRWNKPKDKGNQEVIFLAILSCSFCKTFPAVQDCSKLHMLSLTCCAKKLAASCWERFSKKEKELSDLRYLCGPRSRQATVHVSVISCDSFCIKHPDWLKVLRLEKETSYLMLPSFFQRASFPTSASYITHYFPL